MPIDLPSDLLEPAKAVASTKGYSNVEDYLEDVVRNDLEATGQFPSQNYQQSAQWQEQFRKWIESRPSIQHAVDSSRESIYGDRGL